MSSQPKQKPHIEVSPTTKTISEKKFSPKFVSAEDASRRAFVSVVRDEKNYYFVKLLKHKDALEIADCLGEIEKQLHPSKQNRRYLKIDANFPVETRRELLKNTKFASAASFDMGEGYWDLLFGPHEPVPIFKFYNLPTEESNILILSSQAREMILTNATPQQLRERLMQNATKVASSSPVPQKAAAKESKKIRMVAVESKRQPITEEIGMEKMRLLPKSNFSSSSSKTLRKDSAASSSRASRALNSSTFFKSGANLAVNIISEETSEELMKTKVDDSQEMATIVSDLIMIK